MFLRRVRRSEEAHINLVEIVGEQSILSDWEFRG